MKHPLIPRKKASEKLTTDWTMTLRKKMVLGSTIALHFASRQRGKSSEHIFE